MWLDDDPKFHGSPGCGCPIAKINSRTRPMPSCTPLAPSTFCHAPALLHCSRGWGDGWGVTWRGYRCAGLFQRCCKHSELYVWRGRLVHVAQNLLEDTSPTTHPPGEMKRGVRDSGQNPRTCFASACLGFFT